MKYVLFVAEGQRSARRQDIVLDLISAAEGVSQILCTEIMRAQSWGNDKVNKK